jgi:16S rRNA (guanine966-N2)-methyltransferase
MGFEALSRGATFVDSVEVARAQAESIRQAALNLKVKDRIFVHHQSVASWLGAHQSGGPLYDLIYADPPFTQEYPDLRPFLELLSLAGHAVFECPTQKIPEWILEGGFELRKYGESTLALLSKF